MFQPSDSWRTGCWERNRPGIGQAAGGFSGHGRKNTKYRMQARTSRTNLCGAFLVLAVSLLTSCGDGNARTVLAGLFVVDIAFDPNAGILYGMDISCDELIKIDTATGATTFT